MDKLLDVTSILSVALIVLILVAVRRAHIRVEYSVSWLVAGVLLLWLSRSGGVLQWIGEMVGVGHRPTVLLFAISGILLLVLYRFSMIISDLKDSNIALAQKVAILEYHITALHETIEKKPAA